MYLFLLDGNVQVSMNVFYKNVWYYFGFNIFIFIDLCLTMWDKIIDDILQDAREELEKYGQIFFCVKFVVRRKFEELILGNLSIA